MSAIRPKRTGVRWSLHTDQAGNPNEVDTFQVLSPATITGVTNGGTFLDIAITDPNAGADTFNYTYIVQRSFDGSPFTTIYERVAGAILTSLQDHVMFVIGTTVTLQDGSEVTFHPSIATYVTMHTTPGFNPLAGATLASILFDTEVLRPDGHSQVLPTGTIVTLPAGTNWTTVATPLGHDYAYKVQIKNKFMTTAFSNTDSVNVPSGFTAQTMNVPTRLDNVVTLTWVDPNVYATGQMIEIWKDVDGAGYSRLAVITKTPSAPMPTTYDEQFDFLTLVPATYSYKVRAVSILPRDLGPFSNSQSIVVNFTLLQITGLTATPALGDTQIDLSWTDPNAPIDEAGIYIDRAVGATGQFQRIATVAPGTTSYSDVFPTEPGQTYAYRVTPFNSLHPGPVSATALATTSLLTPTITSLVQISDVGVRVFWSDANAHATAYTIQRSLNGAPFSTVGTPGGADRQFDDLVSLSIGDTVAYQIRAENTFVTGAYSTVQSLVIGRTLVAPINVTPSFVRFGVVNVAWTGLNSGNRGVNIFRSVNGGATTLVATLPKDTRSYTDLFQTIPGQVYAYQVQDFNNQETGPISAFGVTSSPLDAPVSLQIAAVVPPNHVTLQWTFAFLPASTNEDYVSVERSFDGGAFSEIGQVAFGQSPTFFASTTGGVPGSVVSFRIRKIKQAYTIFGTVPVPINFGDYSEVVSTASALSVPTAVTVTRAIAGVNHIAWTDTNTLATGFKVFRQITLDGVTSPLIQIATINNAAVRSYDDTVESEAGEVFSYSILAFNAQTSSIYSGIGTFTARFKAPRIELEQPTRTSVTITWQATVSPGLGGDKIQLLKSLNGGPATVIHQANSPFFSDFLFTDNTVNVGEEIVYTARYFSTTELGPTSAPARITIGDIINTPLGNIKQVRIHGARNLFIQREVFAVGLGGIAKISFDVNNDPVVTSNIDPSVTNAYSGIAGDQTRFMVFTGATPGSGFMNLIDASTLGVITQAPMQPPMPFQPAFSAFWWTSGNSTDTAFSTQKGTINFLADVQTAPYAGGASGGYTGWALADLTNILNMPSGPLCLMAWDSDLSSITQVPTHSVFGIGPVGVPRIVNLPFNSSALSPKRIESFSGDALFCVFDGTATTIYRASRSSLTYSQIAKIPGKAVDMVSDGVAKLLVLTLRGEIYLIDSQFSPTIPTFNIIGRVPATPINTNGDLVDLTTGFMSMELMASRRVAVAIGAQTTIPSMISGFLSQSSIYIFSTPILAAGTQLTLAKTISSIEKIRALAFDGMKYVYALSDNPQYRLIRFDAGF